MGRCSTKTRSSPIRASRSASAGAIPAAASSGTSRPLASSSPTRTSSATASTRPEPHRPRASTSPITPRVTAGSSPVAAGSSRTTSIAPSAARMPHRIAPPSKAGPAGAAVARMVSPSLSTISQLVPTSMKSRVRLSRSIPVASMPATMSPPTYAPRAGKKKARARGCRRQAEVAGEDGRRLRGGHHERRDAERLGVDAQRERGHRGVPGDRHLVDLGGVDAALATDLPGQRGEGLAGRVLEPAEGVLVHHRGADPGDHVPAEGLLPVEHRGHRERGAGADVEQRGDHGGGAEVEGDGVAGSRSCRRARRRRGPRR